MTFFRANKARPNRTAHPWKLTADSGKPGDPIRCYRVMIAAITELNLKSVWSYFRFIPHAVRSRKQAGLSPGIVSIRLRAEGLLIQRTLTVWECEKDMWAFVRSAPHRKAMKAFGEMARTSHTAHFEVSEAPSWEEALEYLRRHGRAY